MTARPVVTRVSQATRATGSFSRRQSSTASEMASATLSGCPSVTDSDVKRLRSCTAGSPLQVGEEERRPDTMLPGPRSPVDDNVENKRLGQRRATRHTAIRSYQPSHPGGGPARV